MLAAQSLRRSLCSSSWWRKACYNTDKVSQVQVPTLRSNNNGNDDIRESHTSKLGEHCLKQHLRTIHLNAVDVTCEDTKVLQDMPCHQSLAGAAVAMQEHTAGHQSSLLQHWGPKLSEANQQPHLPLTAAYFFHLYSLAKDTTLESPVRVTNDMCSILDVFEHFIQTLNTFDSDSLLNSSTGSSKPHSFWTLPMFRATSLNCFTPFFSSGVRDGSLQLRCWNTMLDSSAAISSAGLSPNTFSITSSVTISSWFPISQATRPFRVTVLFCSMYPI
ncbi:hypothetical protein E2C01_039044 [Portunus trituberculatus]|uniref:Uncharacterized protein n=1 Tax=Portunus trituberculatus TaxID=210409 RepID=A0A5B7FIK4_PORTR|nr:hypothetical protein [Portunus trituberculatus]